MEFGIIEKLPSIFEHYQGNQVYMIIFLLVNCTVYSILPDLYILAFSFQSIRIHFFHYNFRGGFPHCSFNLYNLTSLIPFPSVTPAPCLGAMQPTKLFSKGIVTGFRRGQRNQSVNQSLIKVEGMFPF